MEFHKYIIKASVLLIYSRGRKMPWRFSARKTYLDMGVAILIEMRDIKPWVINVSVNGKNHSITKGVTDPVVVCLARRAFTVRNSAEHLVLIQQTLEPPTVADARRELFSGEDIFGGKWPIPKMTEASLGGNVNET